MTGRERVLKAFRHEEPDRTPIWEKLVKLPIANMILGRPHASVDAEYRLERLADGDWQGLMEQEAVDIIELAEICGFDMVRLPTNISQNYTRPEEIGEHTWQIGNVIYEYTPGIPWVKTRPVNPPQRVTSEEEQESAREKSLAGEMPSLETSPPPVYDESTFYVIRRGKEIMKAKGLDLAVFTSCYTLGAATLPGYMFRWFREKPELMHNYYEHNCISGIHRATKLLEEGVDIIGLGGDFASDLGPMISPTDYRDFIASRIRKQSDAIHKLGAPTTNASDGNLWSVLDYFLLDADVDGFEEIDYAAGMDLAKLKERYGDRITFVGNMDVRFILTRGTIKEVKAATIECIEKGWGNGGHVIMSSNCIHEDVKYENFMAHLEAYREYFGLT